MYTFASGQNSSNRSPPCSAAGISNAVANGSQILNYSPLLYAA